MPQDCVQAYLWTALAAAQADAGAVKNMNLLASRMTPAQIASAQELVAMWLKQHAATDDSRANPDNGPNYSIIPDDDAGRTFRL
jgi:hypothetical protein